MEGFPQSRILIVEDYDDSAESLGSLLKIMGCRIEIARDGMEAVNLSATFKPHLILMDLMLPVLDGFEACRRIREKNQGAPPVIVALTGMGTLANRRRSQEAGFDDFLVKPISIESIQGFLPATC
jgi:CheY-like chemotaxis protein